MDEAECISPTDAKQWLFDRARGQSSLEGFLSNNADIQEDNEDEDEEVDFDGKERRDSENYQLPELNEIDKSKLLSCIDEIRNITGEKYSDKRVVEAILSNNFDFNKALDTLLSSASGTNNLAAVATSSTTTTALQTHKIKTTDIVEKGMLLTIYFTISFYSDNFLLL